MLFCYFYLIKLPVLGIKEPPNASSETVCDWTCFLRQLLKKNIEEIEVKISGPGIVVENNKPN